MKKSLQIFKVRTCESGFASPPAWIRKVNYFKSSLKVSLRLDLTAAQMLAHTVEFAETDHTNSDMIILAVLSHGDEGEIDGVDGKFVKEKTLLSMFTDENCPDLVGKPKLFIFLHCR